MEKEGQITVVLSFLFNVLLPLPLPTLITFVPPNYDHVQRPRDHTWHVGTKYPLLPLVLPLFPPPLRGKMDFMQTWRKGGGSQVRIRLTLK